MRSLTIGEVLNRLKDEFDDITISKIRFLESEGLIHPDRTDSGYRKFTDEDVERLRYVLRAQRDRYLPLKVIREELDQLDAGRPVEPPPPPPPPPGTPAAPVATATAAVEGASEVSLVDDEPDELALSLAELCDAVGLETADVRSLQEHGILPVEDRFDGDDVRIARAAVALLDLGLEARHLRMYRQFAERELAVCEQLVAPLLKQRNPDSRSTAAKRVEDLESSGRTLHRLLLGRRLRTLLGS